MIGPHAENVDGIRAMIDGSVGRIFLDRPRALNALDLGMVRRMTGLLDGWRGGSLRAITVESSTPAMFCAGGDIRRIRQNTVEDRLEDSDDFFASEYRLNAMMSGYPVPVVALVDGVCMGGGLGISVHGPVRVVTERALLAMPETAIGFFPDVGASYFLPRLPGGIGTYLALTGARLGPAEAIASGLATHHVTSDRLDALVAALTRDQGPIDGVLRDFATVPTAGADIATQRAVIDRVFTLPSIDAIMRQLDEESGEWASATRAALGSASPQSLELTFDLLVWGRQRSLKECLVAERAAARHVVRSHDFLEGVRAVLVDKDRSPIWGPSQYAGTDTTGTIAWRRTDGSAEGSEREDHSTA
ncbi:enoyl-CoA hydratase/isomerase family protein [Microbacterium terregens]|uniref:3-hydroxyisobutyryl-CoA hydrolase n=1 Tax=Microbacterium terregens TaxID=69363 RepID=A0ABV5SZK7_9MICO